MGPARRSAKASSASASIRTTFSPIDLTLAVDFIRRMMVANPVGNSHSGIWIQLCRGSLVRGSLMIYLAWQPVTNETCLELTHGGQQSRPESRQSRSQIRCLQTGPPEGILSREPAMSVPEMTGAASSFTARAGRPPETFFKAQERNRHATWRMSALCVFAALLMGIPLTLVLSPFFYAVTMAAAEVVNHFSPLPPEFWKTSSDLARLAFRVADAVVNQRGTVNAQELVLAAALIFLPGIVVALMLWAGMLLLFRHGGVGGTLASLNAREPNPQDLKELQLADTVQEMAIAAGVPAPRVMLIDSPGANAAAIGTCATDAHIVLCRRLLDDLNREQLQALVGHLVASVGNGDLRIAFTVTSIFETCGLIVTLINAPFGRQSRSTLWRIIRYSFRRGTGAAKAADAEQVAELLADTLDMNSSDIDRFFNSSNPGLIRKALRLMFFPFLFTNIAVELTLWFFLNLLL